MDPKELLDALDDARIVEAIRRAEDRSRGEIRVHVTSDAEGDPKGAAAEAFARLGMTATAERNGILIYVSPRAQTFAIVGDEGVHRLCGEAFWRDVAAALEYEFRERRFTEGILRGIERAGDLLARHFPRLEGKSDRDELPNAVSRD
ncbi:MAG TPA: TPM domain-containing protein [Vicinamibacteria bacterium]|jgi:uncharacterized membrane protein